MADASPSDRWSEIDGVFREALELEPGEWPGFLDERCAGDAELHSAAWRLLDADQHAGSFLGSSADGLAPGNFGQAIRTQNLRMPPARIGEHVGSFRIVRQLGSGGMADVYLAVRADGEFEQQVAIKFLRPGLDTQDFVRRFLAERQILSSLDHPNIARLIDGGTTQKGLPYLAMEYVDGRPITEYCRRNAFALEDRLELFIEVARAVQHAHANLVVHRDIKPSNLLVTGAGRVKLLDFGIAKLLNPGAASFDAPLTRTGLRPLTPEYASPEQIRGEVITTASDVYQLGVLLYRLLTGSRPYGASGTHGTIESAITDTDPTRPSEAIEKLDQDSVDVPPGSSRSRWRRRLLGDLDTIVLKALRKDPTRRYSTALEMADDVRRHLDGLPINARGESPLYRAGKFLRRHRWAAPVSVAAAFLLVAYVGTLIRHGKELEFERNVAQDVQQAFVSFFTAPDSGDTGLGEGRRNLTILEAIQDGTEGVRRDLADRPAARAELFGTMAAVLQDLDEPAQAYELAVEALELERDLYGEASPQVHETLLMVGQLNADPDSARTTLEQRLSLSLALHGEDDPETAASHHALGLLDFQDGRLGDAEQRLATAVSIYRESESHPRRLAEALTQLASTLSTLDRAEEAVIVVGEAYEVLRKTLGEQHSVTASTGATLAQTLTALGRNDEARPLYELSLATMDAELGRIHATTMSSRNNYAILLRLMGDLAASETVYNELLGAQRKRYGPVHAEVAASLQNLAVVVKDEERYDEAERLAFAAHEMFKETRGTGHFHTAFPLLTISEIRLARGDFYGAEDVSREALAILQEALPEGHFATAVAECRVGQALAGQGRTIEARPLLESGIAALQPGERPEADAYRELCVAVLEAL